MPRLLASTACVAACLAAVSLAQQAPSQPLPQFRTGVEVIEVDVSVLDRDRRPVRGLTAKDFTLLEEGRPQEIVSFTSIDVPEPEPVSTAWMRDIAPDVSANLAGADRLVVLVIDDAQVRIGPQHAQTTKSIARRVIDQLGPRDLAAVVFTRDNSGAQPFTSNRSRLLAAVDSFSPGFTGASGTGDFSIDYFYRSSMLTLKYVVESLADAGQRRKAVIYVSPGIPLEGNSLEVYSRRNDALQIFREAQRANVTFYGIDPSGLGGLDREDPIASGLASDLIRSPQSVLNDFLHSLASNTGGLAIVNRNEFASGVAQIFAENGSYYLLGYRAAQQSTAQKRDGQLRRIEVRVNRPGVTVRARTGYVGPRSEAPPKTGAPSGALVKALRDVTPRGDVAMQVMAAPFAVPGRKPAAVALVIALRQPKPPSTGPLTEQVDMIISAYGPAGERRGGQRLNAKIALRAGEDATIRYELLSQIPLEAGRYQLRFAAESSMQGKNGSVAYDLEVPDFSKGDVALSGIAISAAPNVTSAPKDALVKLIPVVPTTRREFWSQDQVSAFLRVYLNKPKSAPAELTVRIVDGSDRIVHDARETFGAERFGADRSADYRLEVPVARLMPGPHLLTIEVKAGKTSVRRDVRFVKR